MVLCRYSSAAPTVHHVVPCTTGLLGTHGFAITAPTTAMEAHPDFGRCNGDIGGHVDEIAKDLAGLGVVVAAHAAGGQAVEGRGEDEEGHVEIDFEPDRGGERVDVEETHGFGECVLDEHALGVAGNEIPSGGFRIVGDQDRGLVVAEILDE